MIGSSPAVRARLRRRRRRGGRAWGGFGGAGGGGDGGGRGGGLGMRVSRPVQVRAGTEIRYRGGLHTVVTVSSTTVDLADVTGVVMQVRAAELVADPGFAV